MDPVPAPRNHLCHTHPTMDPSGPLFSGYHQNRDIQASIRHGGELHHYQHTVKQHDHISLDLRAELACRPLQIQEFKLEDKKTILSHPKLDAKKEFYFHLWRHRQPVILEADFCSPNRGGLCTRPASPAGINVAPRLKMCETRA